MGIRRGRPVPAPVREYLAHVGPGLYQKPECASTAHDWKWNQLIGSYRCVVCGEER